MTMLRGTEPAGPAPARLGLVGDLVPLILLGAPAVLAFFTGGYFAPARTVAGAVVWVLAAILLATRAGTPLRGRARLALGGLVGLAAWTAASAGWAPIAGRAYGATQIVVLYLGALLAASLALRPGTLARRCAEPALALGAAIVTGYGLAGRLLPGVLHFSRSASAQGRLEQPLTYWNAMGELAALGLVLCARIAGDGRRSTSVRAAAAAAAAPAGLALYTSFSRGALFAALAGLLTLTVTLPRRGQIVATATALTAGIVTSAAIAPLHGVTNLHGSLPTRETQGAVALGVLLVVMVLAAAVQARAARAAREGERVALPRHSGWVAAALVCAGLALAIGFGAKERSGVPISGGAGRLVSLQSNRYAYWRVALKAFAHAPVIGVGAGGWSVWWLRDRPYADGAENAHSLELETLAELGLIGLALLASWLAGIGLAARSAVRLDPQTAAGPLGLFVCWLAHSPLDWDWQMPAVTLIAMIAGGCLLAQAGGALTSSARAGLSTNQGEI